MKRIILIIFLGILISGKAFSQIQVQGEPLFENINGDNSFLDASTSFDKSVDVSAAGKGLSFPRMDLSNWSFFLTRLFSGSSFYRGAFDGMIVYNTVTGDTPTTGNNPSTSTHVTPGFYYFSNPTGADDMSITNGKWIRLNDSNRSTLPSGGTNPATGNSGDLFYNTTTKSIYYYKDTEWVTVSTTPSGTSTPVSGEIGELFYHTNANPALNVLKIYDGTSWVSLGGAVADNTINAAKLQGSTGSALDNGTSGWLLQSNGDGKFSWLDTSGGLPVDASSITLASGSFLVGGAGGTAAATLKSAIPLSGFGAAAADMAMGNNKITGLATPTAASDAATKGYVDGLVVDNSATNEGLLSVLVEADANSASIHSNTTGSNNITFVGAGGNLISETGNTITITAPTPADISPLNEAQGLSAGGTTSPTIDLSKVGVTGGGTVTFVGAGGTSLNQAGGTITITSANVAGANLTSTDITVTGGTGATLTAASLAIANDAITSAKILNGTIASADLDKANIPLSGFGAAAADVAMGNNKITGLATPTAATDAATMAYVDTKASSTPSGDDLPAAGATAGNTFFETDTDILWVSDGTAWLPLSTGGTTPSSSATPSNPVAGDVYYDTDDNNMYYYNGTSWVMLNGVATGGSTPAAGSGTVGETFYNTTTNTYYVYDDGVWNAVGSGDMLKSTYDTNNNGIVDVAATVSDDAITTAKIANGTIADADLNKTAIPLSGFGAAAANVAMGNNKITGLATPTAATDAATMAYVDTKASSTPSGDDLPAVGAAGNTFFETDTDILWVSDGTAWLPLSTGGTTPSSSETPSNPVAGDVYYDTDDNNMYYYNGTSWVMLNGVATGGSTPAAGSGTVGETFYNTTTNTYYVYDDGVWNAVGSGDMLKSTYDTNNNGIVDVAATVSDDAITTAKIANGTIADADLNKTAIPLSGFGAAAANVAMGNNKITGLATPTAATDAATMAYVDTKASSTPSGDDLPAVGAAGNTFFETDTDILWVSDGTAWLSLSTGGTTPSSSATPSNPVAGDVYYDTDDNNMYYYNGTSWVMLNGVATGGSTPAAGSGTVGETFYNTTTNTYYVYDDGVWNAVGSGDMLKSTYDTNNNGIVDVAATVSDDAITTAKIANGTIADADLNKTAIPLSGFGAAAADVAMGSNKITGLLNPTSNQDAATKKYVDDAIIAGASGNVYQGTVADITAFNALNWANITSATNKGTSFPANICNLSATAYTWVAFPKAWGAQNFFYSYDGGVYAVFSGFEKRVFAAAITTTVDYQVWVFKDMPSTTTVALIVNN